MELQSPVYYAHSKLIYNTKRESRELSALKRMSDLVICPNKHIGERQMEDYLSVITIMCKTVVCSEYDGYIGKGVAEETFSALRAGKSVYVLRQKEKGYKLIPIKNVKIIDDTDWKNRYAKLVIK
jgi:hypothetical protein